MKMLIKNGRIIDPASNTDEVKDILVTDGIIEKVAKDIDDASGLRHKKMNYEAYYDSDYIYHGM